MRATAPESARPRSFAAIGCLALLVSACGGGGQATPPLTAASVQQGALGYQHRLHVNYYMLCEQTNGSARCRGLHPLDTIDDGWTTFADGFSRISLGGLTLCGLIEGRVVCWGEDPTGQLDPNSLERALCTDQAFYGLTGVRELAMNEDTGCVITEAGVVRCWGPTLGPEAYDDYALHDVLEGAHGLAIGLSQGCALTDAGVRCWGDAVGRTEGEEEEAPLSPGETYGVNVPDPVQVVVGEGFACARSEDRRVSCWGYDTDGSLGRGEVPEEERFGPREVPGLRAVDLVASDDNVCARGEDGRSYCWGSNTSGQLGVGHTRRVNTPTHVPALDGVLDVALATDTICARFADGSVRCAGDYSPLQNEPGLDVMTPQRLPGVQATRLHLSEREACVSTSAGTRCFGDGGYLLRGHQEAAAGWTPDAVVSGDIAQLSFHARRPCTRWQDGRLLCDDPALRVEQRGTLGFAAGGTRACFIDAGRQVQCWTRGQSAPPAPIVGLADATFIAMDQARVCAVTTRGGLVCRTTAAPAGAGASALASSLADVRAVALGGDRTCGLRQGGQLVCWEGDAQQTGEVTGVTAVAYARGRMCVVQAGRVRCVRFDQGAMSLEEPVPDVEDVVELASGGEFLCARNAGGQVRCWGRNRHSQFGVLMPTLRLDFTPVSNVEVYPERAATFECQGVIDDPEYDDYGYEEYEEDGY